MLMTDLSTSQFFEYMEILYICMSTFICMENINPLFFYAGRYLFLQKKFKFGRKTKSDIKSYFESRHKMKSSV